MSAAATTTAATEAPKNVTAACVPIRVVAVKWPDHFIVRGIYCFDSVEHVRARVAPFVAICPPDELEWTTHEYFLPAYLAYGGGDLPRIGWPGQGVFLFDHLGHGDYRGEARRLS